MKVRPDMFQYAFVSPSFNSRTCEGATRKTQEELALEGVSIHAPVKVRQSVIVKGEFHVKFQFTHL